jgi:hypothetical protein
MKKPTRKVRSGRVADLSSGQVEFLTALLDHADEELSTESIGSGWAPFARRFSRLMIEQIKFQLEH